MNIQRQFAVTKPEFITTILLFVLIAVMVLSSRLIRLTSGSSLVFEEQTEILLPGNSGLLDLQQYLESEDIRFDKTEMEWAARILGWRKMQRGRYVFEGEYSYNGFLSKMARGIQDPVSVVILPGITTDRFTQTTAENLHFDSDSLLTLMNDSSFLAEKDLSKEELFGRMLPETYLIYWTSSPKEFLNKVLREFDNAFTQEYREQAEEMDMTINEVVTLASIVEWEAKNQDEKPIISGLYWNRLNRGMRLQADPTVNFALGERRRLLFEDYQIDHPYNTYMNSGLPPGPITNPSFSTIEATLYPEDHDYLYMVANPEGGHVFTRTFSEHQAESEKWRRWLREQYRIKRQREAEQQANEQETR
ncbi:MAG: endolytic transglycosylase MltG [Gracilimonas sp.]|uniref:endolytic transglycosylase MltG n=1 Tax=Gracilimonas TaxID=649462 RepID=UPI001B2F2093|nr:endolytic transglycosylase MltG [Gracilimonas sp.]MBO6586478.1 endolytic transglycosylase MltG [Gracilimonas sp.]MBO6615135.1 endolytic transglycosylase MltG [Gracilimonas sp.]